MGQRIFATRPTRRWTPAVATLVGFALATAVVGIALIAERIGSRAPAATSSATLGGLTVDVREAGWTSMDAHSMDQQGGYQMPAQMMPGAPAGDEMRLGIRVSILNAGEEARQFHLADEFVLLGGASSDPRRPHSDTFGPLSRLNPGSAVDGILYFDTITPGPQDPPLVLRWNRAGDTADIPVPVGGAAPDHHGS
jgi:hypothetical protein